MSTKQHLGRFVVAFMCLNALGYAAVPRFAYVANFDDNTLSIFSVMASTGQLRANGYKPTASGPRAVVVVPSGKFVYVANQNSNNISAFTANLSNGQLVTISGSPFSAGTSPRGLTTDPLGKFLFAANYSSNNITSYRINSTSGALTEVGTFYTPNAPRDLLVHSSGKFLYVINQSANKVSAYIIDPVSGGLTSVAGSPFATASMPFALTFGAAGRFLYVANYGSNTVSAFVVNSTTGQLSKVSGSPFGAGSQPYSLATMGRFLYVSDSGSGRVVAFATNGTTGALSAIAGASYPAGSYPASIVLKTEPSGRFLYATNTLSLNTFAFAINATYGTLTSLGDMRSRGQAIAMAVSAGTTPVKYVPKFAYALDGCCTLWDGPGNPSADGNTLTSFSIDAATGNLFNKKLIPVQTVSDYIEVDPFGAFLYQAWDYRCDGGLDVYRVNASTGALAAANRGYWAGACSGSPQFAADPGGKFVLFGGPWISVINRTTAQLTDAIFQPEWVSDPPLGQYTTDRILAVDPLGRFFYLATPYRVLGYRYDAVTGAGTQAVDFPINVAQLGPVHPSGKFLYVANGGTLTALRINAASGTLTVASTSAIATGPMEIEPRGKFLYAINSSGIWAYSISPSNGAVSLISGSPFGAGIRFTTIHIEQSGTYMYLTAEAAPSQNSPYVYGYRIDQSTGRLSPVTGARFYASSLGTGLVKTVTGIQ